MTEEIKLKFTIDGKEVVASLGNYDELLKRVVNDFKKGSEDAVSSFAKIGNSITGINQGLELVKKAYDILSRPIELAGQFEQYEAQLKVMLGSADAAKQRLSELVEFAKNTPFDLPGVVEAANQLQALGKYSEGNLTMLGDLASASGKPMEQALSAYAKLVTGQKGIAVDMFRDLLITTQDWIDATGKGVSKNGELLASTSELIGAIPKIMEKKNFSGMMAEQAKMINGQISNMMDAFGQLQTAAGKALLPFASEIVKYGGQLAAALTPVETNLEKVTKASRDQRTEFEILANRILRLKETNEKSEAQLTLYKDAVTQITSKYGDYLGKINIEKESYEKVAAAINKARESLIEKAKTDAIIATQQDKYNEIAEQQKKIIELESLIDEKTAKFKERYGKDIDVNNPDYYGTAEAADIRAIKGSISSRQKAMEEIESDVKKMNEKYKGILDKALGGGGTDTETDTGTDTGAGTTATDDSFAKNKAKLTEEITLTRELNAEKERLAELEDNREVFNSIDEAKANIELINDLMLKAKDEAALKKLEYDKKYNEEALKLAEAELKKREDLMAKDMDAHRKSVDEKIKYEEELKEERKKQEEESAKLIADAVKNKRKVQEEDFRLGQESYNAQESLGVQANRLTNDLIRESISAYIAKAVMAQLALAAETIPWPASLLLLPLAGLTMQAALEAAIPKFAKGGIINGALHSAGGVMINAEGGEYIINRKAAAANLDLLESINAGKNMNIYNSAAMYSGGSDGALLSELAKLNLNFERYSDRPIIIGKDAVGKITSKGRAQNRRSRV